MGSTQFLYMEEVPLYAFCLGLKSLRWKYSPHCVLVKKKKRKWVDGKRIGLCDRKGWSLHFVVRWTLSPLSCSLCLGLRKGGCLCFLGHHCMLLKFRLFPDTMRFRIVPSHGSRTCDGMGRHKTLHFFYIYI